MISAKEFHGLSAGDQIEGPPLLQKLSDEPIVLLTVLKTKSRAEFVASFQGIALGRWVCSLVDGELKWQL